MKKLSKSDLGPDYEARVKEAAAKPKAKSQHFAVETAVIYNRRRYIVNQYVHDTVILIDAETGAAVRVDNPYFMQWR